MSTTNDFGGDKKAWQIGKGVRYKILVEKIQNAITTDGIVKLQNENHIEITQALRAFAFSENISTSSINFLYEDGSLGESFILGQSKLMSAAESEVSNLPSFKIGLMSFRHPELDYLVDFYISRNMNTSSALSLAESEKVSYGFAIECLSSRDIIDGAKIFAFHTGYQSMIIGFYRGVMDVLQQRRRSRRRDTLCVVPMIYVGKKDINLSTANSNDLLSKESLGAEEANYTEPERWG